MRANAMKKATRRTTKCRKKKLYNKHQAQKLVVVRKKFEKIEDEGEKENGWFSTRTPNVYCLASMFQMFHNSSALAVTGLLKRVTSDLHVLNPQNHYYAFVVKSYSFANNESNIFLSLIYRVFKPDSLFTNIRSVLFCCCNITAIKSDKLLSNCVIFWIDLTACSTLQWHQKKLQICLYLLQKMTASGQKL